MPEMPEVIAHSERLNNSIAGQGLVEFQLLNFASLKTFEHDSSELGLVVSVFSRGKYIVFEFENSMFLVIHLMQAGRLKSENISKISSKPKFGLARFIFTCDDGKQSWILTEAGKERKAGIWIIRGDIESQLPISKLGPDIDKLTVEEFTKILESQSKRIHGVLRAQQTFAGVGRLLANEICHAAKISPFANTSKLDENEIAALHKAINNISASALEHERTLSDIGKSADRPSKVHNRKEENCLSCKEGIIRTIEYNAYTVFYCPNCQTNGKILADNTTSKFLK